LNSQELYYCNQKHVDCLYSLQIFLLLLAGVISGDLSLSDQTVLGEWKIEATAAVSLFFQLRVFGQNNVSRATKLFDKLLECFRGSNAESYMLNLF